MGVPAEGQLDGAVAGGYFGSYVSMNRSNDSSAAAIVSAIHCGVAGALRGPGPATRRFAGQWVGSGRLLVLSQYRPGAMIPLGSSAALSSRTSSKSPGRSAISRGI